GPGLQDVAVEGLRGLTVRGRQRLDPGEVSLVLLLLLERAGEGLDPSGDHAHAPSVSCRVCCSSSIRAARKLQLLQNSESCSRPASLSVKTLRGGPFSDGTFSTSTRPRCSMRTRRA